MLKGPVNDFATKKNGIQEIYSFCFIWKLLNDLYNVG